MDANIDFYVNLGRVLLQCAYSGRTPEGNWRYGPPEPDAQGIRGFAIPDRAVGDLDAFTGMSEHFPAYNRVFQLLEDHESCRILTLLTAYRILGPERVMLPISPSDYTDSMAKLAPLMVKENTYKVDLAGMHLDLYDLSPAGMNLKAHTTRSALLAHFFLAQYRLNRDGASVTAEPGDTVIEGGMCFGDTALWFADLVGESGKVVGFEFEPNNLKVLRENLSLHPELAKRIVLKENALANVSGEKLSFVMAGPATTMGSLEQARSFNRETIEAETLTIDDLVKREGLDRVDFIKLDVEGAELNTLIGAADTLMRHKPKLALSAYHKLDDVPALAGYLHSLDLGYKFWLEHFRPYAEETVLFAKVDSRRGFPP